MLDSENVANAGYFHGRVAVASLKRRERLRACMARHFHGRVAVASLKLSNSRYRSDTYGSISTAAWPWPH